MPKANKHGSPQPESSANTANTAGANTASTSADNTLQTSTKATASSPSSSSRNKQSSKNTSSRVGGTAVQGAKSTQPKQITSNDPQQQQAESYNRQMRRRMEHLGTSSSQNPDMERNRKRIEKRRRRAEERRQEVKKVAASGPRDIRIGRKVVYFLIAVAVLVVGLIVLAIVINHPF